MSDDIRGEVKFYSYRSAMVREVFLKLPRELMNDLEDTLAKKAGVRADNHTVYELTQDDLGVEHKTYFWFHDLHVFVGRAIEVGRH